MFEGQAAVRPVLRAPHVAEHAAGDDRPPSRGFRPFAAADRFGPRRAPASRKMWSSQSPSDATAVVPAVQASISATGETPLAIAPSGAAGAGWTSATSRMGRICPASAPSGIAMPEPSICWHPHNAATAAAAAIVRIQAMILLRVSVSASAVRRAVATVSPRIGAVNAAAYFLGARASPPARSRAPRRWRGSAGGAPLTTAVGAAAICGREAPCILPLRRRSHKWRWPPGKRRPDGLAKRRRLAVVLRA